MRRQFLTSIVLALAGATIALASDNLILNGSFATNLANWDRVTERRRGRRKTPPPTGQLGTAHLRGCERRFSVRPCCSALK
jgi:hypothetical protein